MKQAQANHAVHSAITGGELVRSEVCSECGVKSATDAHHDDYSKPLDVRWLCRRCHVNFHQENGAVWKGRDTADRYVSNFHLRIPRSLHTRIEKVARDEHRSLAAQIRHAVELHVDEAESNMRGVG